MRKGLLLSNVRVVEVAEGWAGPLAGLLLADLGAEVIKVESINRMDMERGPGGFRQFKLVRLPSSILAILVARLAKSLGIATLTSMPATSASMG